MAVFRVQTKLCTTINGTKHLMADPQCHQNIPSLSESLIIAEPHVLKFKFALFCIANGRSPPQSNQHVSPENASNAISNRRLMSGCTVRKSPQLVVSTEQEVRVVCEAWASHCSKHSSGAVVGFDQQPAHLPQLVSQAASPGNWGLSAEEVALSGQNTLSRPPVSLKTGDGDTL